MGLYKWKEKELGLEGDWNIEDEERHGTGAKGKMGAGKKEGNSAPIFAGLFLKFSRPNAQFWVGQGGDLAQCGGGWIKCWAGWLVG